MTKIACISDTHTMAGQLYVPPDVDLVIHAGDLTNYGTDDELLESIKWLADLPGEKILVPGNHDIDMEDNPQKYSDLCLQYGIILLVDEGVRVCGLNVYGSPYTPSFGSWAFMEDDFVLANRWENIPYDVDVLVTHGPALGVLDVNPRGEYCGSRTLRGAIAERSSIRAHVFGHIHCSAGIAMAQPGYMAVNAAVCNERYQPYNPVPIIHM